MTSSTADMNTQRLRTLGVLSKLELAAEDKVLLLTTIARPPSDAGHGAGFLAVVALSVAQLLTPQYFGLLPTERASLPFVSATEAAKETSKTPFDMKHHLRDVGVVLLLDPNGPVRPLTGSVEQRLDELGTTIALDGRQAPSVAHLLHEEGEFVIANDNGNVEVFAIERAAVQQPTLVPAVMQAAIEAPPVVHWIEQVAAEPWICERSMALANSALSLDRLEAAGLLARLWVPLASHQQQLLEGTLEGPLASVTGWMQQRTPEQREALERQALREADRLAEELEELPFVDSAERATQEASLLRTRDRLENVLFVLRLVDAGSSLARRLDTVDRLGADRIDDFVARESYEDDPQLTAAAIREPDQWWSIVVMG